MSILKAFPPKTMPFELSGHYYKNHKTVRIKRLTFSFSDLLEKSLTGYSFRFLPLPIEAKKTQRPHERKISVVIWIPVVSLLPLGQRLLTEQFHHLHGFGISRPGNLTEQPGTQTSHAQGIF